VAEPELLDRLVDRVLGGESAEQLLAEVPPSERTDYATLLRVVQQVREVERPGLSPAAARRQERRLLEQAARLREVETPSRNGAQRANGVHAAPPGAEVARRGRGWKRLAVVPGVVAAAITIVVLLVGGAVGAAAGSLPTSPLYPLKLASEQVQLALSMNAEDRARVYVLLAQRRLDEADQIARAGDPRLEPELEGLLDAAQDNIGTALGLAESLRGQVAIEMLTSLDGLIAQQRSLLESLLPNVPAARQASVQRELTAAQENEQVVQRRLRQRIDEGPSGAAGERRTATSSTLVALADGIERPLDWRSATIADPRESEAEVGPASGEEDVTRPGLAADGTARDSSGGARRAATAVSPSETPWPPSPDSGVSAYRRAPEPTPRPHRAPFQAAGLPGDGTGLGGFAEPGGGSSPGPGGETAMASGHDAHGATGASTVRVSADAADGETVVDARAHADAGSAQAGSSNGAKDAGSPTSQDQPAPPGASHPSANRSNGGSDGGESGGAHGNGNGDSHGNSGGASHGGNGNGNGRSGNGGSHGRSGTGQPGGGGGHGKGGGHGQ